MTFPIGSRLSGTRLALVMSGIAAIAVSVSAFAQDPAPGPDVDQEVFKLFLESRIQKPADQATAMERTNAMVELQNVYLVSDLPLAKELAEDAGLKAQMELQRRGMLYNVFVRDFIAKNPASEQEIFNLYEEQVASAPPKEYKARHILVESQSLAMDLIKELQDGADFAELAKAKSTGPSGPNGGDLGWFNAQSMVKPFSDAVKTLEDGESSSAPVQTQFGWHVILREESRDGIAPTLESVRDVIKNQVEQRKFQDFVKSLR